MIAPSSHSPSSRAPLPVPVERRRERRVVAVGAGGFFLRNCACVPTSGRIGSVWSGCVKPSATFAAPRFTAAARFVFAIRAKS